MFESLSSRLTGIFNGLGSKGRLTEKDVDVALRDIRMALLEADVNFKVARSFVDRIRERAVQEDVLKSLTPGQQVVKITNDELTQILGASSSKLESGSGSNSILLMVGLNGSGKTTTTAKIAKYLTKAGQTNYMVAADLHRPAAIDQLEILGKQIDVKVYRGADGEDVEHVVANGIKNGISKNSDWTIIDTAGRFQVDDDLMVELETIKEISQPLETLLVIDSMTGQEAVNVANDFNERIGLTGLVMTKMDGDARGGAALSIFSETNVPIKFIGVGERLDDLEEFHPDRLASRILGMGDMLTLIEKAEKSFDQQNAIELNKKMRQDTFDLNDFLGQLEQLKKMGSFGQIMDLIPGMSGMKSRMEDQELGDKNLTKIEAIIFSMTPQERQNPSLIGGKRRRRIAQGSGTKPQDVNQLLNQFRQAQKMMKQLASGKGMRDFQRMFK